MPKKDLMLTKKEIEEALRESQIVKRQYKSFWKFYEMLLELNDALMHIEECAKTKSVKKK